MTQLTTRHHSSKPGQIGIVVLLIMSVLLTVGVSLSANANRDLLLSQQGEESNRVFNAAEGGIEQALNSLTSGTFSGVNDVSVSYQVADSTSIDTRLFEGVSVEVDVTGASGNLTVQWSHEQDCVTQTPASLLVTVYSDVSGQLLARHLTAAACARGDGFDESSVSIINSDDYRRQLLIALGPDDRFIRIKPVYNDTHLRISGVNLPTQGYQITSQAVSDIGTETRVVQVNRSLPTAPSFMDYALVSGTTLIK